MESFSHFISTRSSRYSSMHFFVSLCKEVEEDMECVEMGDMEAKEARELTSEQVVLFMGGQAAQAPASATGNNSMADSSSTGLAMHASQPKAQQTGRLSFTKPKSRFQEPKSRFQETKYSKSEEPQPTIEKKPPSSDDDSDLEPHDEDGEEGITPATYQNKKKKMKKGRLIEWLAFLLMTPLLVCSLTLEPLKSMTKWNVEIWHWCLMIMAIICGRLVAGCVVGILVFFIQKNFVLRKKVLYFVYGLQRSFRNCLWFGLVLASWSIMFSPDEVKENHPILLKVFKTLIAICMAATIWLIKILLVKILASSFHVSTFFERMKESVFHHYILEMLSGPSLDETDPDMYEMNKKMANAQAKLKIGSLKRSGSRKIDMEKLRKLSMTTTANAWSFKRLLNFLKSTGLSTISRTVEDFGKADSEVTTEDEMKALALWIFKHVAKPGAKYIEEEDLLRFLRMEEVHTIFPHFEGAIETGQIRKSAFRNWVLYTYRERKSLAHSLNDTKTAVNQLHKLASSIVFVIIIVVFLLQLDLATTKVIFLIMTQLLLVGFMFQNTVKTIFESIIFVFVMHPFDVGDRCVIDGVQMIVEEMNILTTVFLRYDNEKIFYPNSVLSTKPISNFYRSPEMGDSVDFTIDVSTPVETINALKRHIQVYIESKPEWWKPGHGVVFKDIENMDKLKMCLSVSHTMNHQNFGEKSSRRSELVFELKKIFERLGISYHFLPQEIHVTQINTAGGKMPLNG